MPQMSPMNWLCLFIFFNMIFFVSVVKLYYFSVLYVNKEGDPTISVSLLSFKI